jgi:dGTP triphosphohydrolase
MPRTCLESVLIRSASIVPFRAPDDAGKTRVVTDVLATMSEDQVQKVHRSASEVDWTLA